MPISSLFTVARKWKQLRSPSYYENIITIPYTWAVEFSFAVKKNKGKKLACKLIELGSYLLQKLNHRRTITDATWICFVNNSPESLDLSMSLVVTTKNRKVEKDHVWRGWRMSSKGGEGKTEAQRNGRGQVRSVALTVNKERQ